MGSDHRRAVSATALITCPLPHCVQTTEQERVLFGLVSIAFVLNSVAVPLFCGVALSLYSSGKVVDQTWYEPGGVVAQVHARTRRPHAPPPPSPIAALPVLLHAEGPLAAVTERDTRFVLRRSVS